MTTTGERGEKGGEGGGNEARTVFFIGKQKFEVEAEQLTVRALLTEYAREDPNETVLVLKKGNDVHKYTDLDEVIELKNGMHFTVYHTGPTTVS